MPLYTVHNKVTDEQRTMICSYESLEEFLKDNPDYIQLIGTPAIVSGVSGRSKPDDNFKDLVKNIKKNNPGSTLDV